MPGAVIIGAGPGIGRSVARRFAAEGMPVALIARTRASLDVAAEAVVPLGVPVVRLRADSADETELRAALDAAADRFGPPDVVVYNAAIIRPDAPGQLTVDEHRRAWTVNVVGALTAAAHTAPMMAGRGGGTFIVTGGMPEPKAAYVSLSLGKAGVRTLVDLLDQEYAHRGIHVASVTVAGPVAPGTGFDPDDIAEHYWRLHTQPFPAWQREVLHHGRDEDDPDAEPRRIVTTLLDTWKQAFNGDRVDDLVRLFAHDALFQGVGVDPATGHEAIRDYYGAATGSTATVRVRQARQQGERVVTGLADIDFSTTAGNIVPVRLSLVAGYTLDDSGGPGKWLIVLYHAAMR